MTAPIERIRNLIALADQDNEEGRTSAHLALKLLRKHGFVITVATLDEEPVEQPRYHAPPPPSPPPSQHRREILAIVGDEVVQFFRTMNVLPRDIPATGVQMAPASDPGYCLCGRRYQRGEMVSRMKPHRCARCIARRR